MEVSEVKQVIANRNLVTYKDMNFTVTAYVLRLQGNEWLHIAELHDLKANSVINVRMKDVVVKKERYNE